MSEQKHVVKGTIKFAASEVAAVCGMNPFANLSDLVNKYVYQNRPELLEADSETLGLEILTDEEQAQAIISKADTDVQEKIKQIRVQAASAASSTKVRQLQKRSSSAISAAQASGHITKEESKLLMEHTHRNINVTYGNRHEHPAIQMFEKQTGLEVYAKNERCYELEFPYTSSITTKEMETGQMDTQEDGSDIQIVEKEPFFAVRGWIDGLVDIPVAINSDSGECDIHLETHVLEIKARVHTIKDPPPWYDQVQVLAYLKLVGCSRAVLVQLLKTDIRARARVRGSPETQEVAASHADESQQENEDKDEEKKKKNEKEEKSDQGAQDEDEDTEEEREGGPQPASQLHMNIISCTDLPHKDAWENTVVPRLYQYATMIMAIRNDSTLRWRWLMMSPDEQVAYIRSSCDFL